MCQVCCRKEEDLNAVGFVFGGLDGLDSMSFKPDGFVNSQDRRSGEFIESYVDD